MKHDEINEVLRNIFNQLINDGYRKKHICDITNGSQKLPQFDQLINGGDLGLKPLERIFNSMGYELMITPIPKDNEEKKHILKEYVEEFIDASKFSLVECLESAEVIRETKKTKVSSIFIKTVDDIFNSIT